MKLDMSTFFSRRHRCRHFLFAALIGLLSLQAHADGGRERLSLDRGWLFHLGDIPFPVPATQDETYYATKAGLASGAAAVTFDASTWRKLDLPHDWQIEQPFDPKANPAHGFRQRGIGWYRRYVALPESDRGRHVELELGAIATHATVWVNGNLVNRNWSGYNAIQIDITPYLQYGADHPNVVAIRVDANAMEGWWYEGAGMYRHAWLVKTDAVHIVPEGVRVTPRQGKGGAWEIPAQVTLDNDGKQDARVDVEMVVTGPDGKQVARRSTKIDVPVLTQVTASLPMTIPHPSLWTLDKSTLYHVTTTVRRNGKTLDQLALDTGFRSLRFDADRGFFLNGAHVKLQGVCLHQDHAGVGVAVPDAIWEYRLRRLKELGVNALRMSHNAIAPEVLDIADRMGFLVMAENRNFNPSPDYMKQLEWMVKRDRHHPSVILWSVFNEEPVQATEAGYEMARRMVAVAKALDGTRPTTAAMSGGMLTPLNVSHAVDVVGINYQIPEYDKYHAANPTRPLTSAEDTSAFMTRGEFATDDARHVKTSYDVENPFWGNTHRDAWQAIGTRDFVAGGFVWTGFDYHGESWPYTSWPSVSSFFGIMDLNGFPKTAYYMHQVQWIKDRPLVYIAPHWNWPGKEGQEIVVRVMANVERVKLLLNGREIGEQKVDNYRMNDFKVKYEAGKLEAIAYNGGKEVARTSVETTGPAVALELVPDRGALAGDGRDAMPITVRALDAQGRAVPVANDEVSLSVVGAGKSIGTGNGDPNSHEDEKGKTRRLFNGLAQLIVQSDWDSNGAIEVRATAPGLQPATVRIPVKAVAPVPYVAVAAAPKAEEKH
jgi:beta-galactosidase